MIITAFNPTTDGLEKSYLANPYSAGVTTVVVKNANKFSANDRLLIGKMGTETAEVVTLSGVAADNVTLTIGATLYAHSADEPVYQLQFDQIKFYRSTDSGSTYTVLSTQNMDVDNADLQTKYDDTTGASTYYYKFTFYHSIAAVESAYSDPVQGSGWRRDQFGYIIDEILQEVSDPQEVNITRSELIGYFNDVNDDLQTTVSKPYDFLHTRTTLTRTAATNYINFPTDSNGRQTMWKFDRMDYNYTDSTTSPATDITTTIEVMPPEEFRNTYSDNTNDSTTQADTTPARMTLDTSVNRFRFSQYFETTAAGVFYLHYWKYFTTIDSEGDSIETPTAKIYKLYAKGMYYRKRAVAESSYEQTADRYFADYQSEKVRLKSLDRKDQGTPRSFSIPNSTIKGFRR